MKLKASRDCVSASSKANSYWTGSHFWGATRAFGFMKRARDSVEAKSLSLIVFAFLVIPESLFLKPHWGKENKSRPSGSRTERKAKLPLLLKSSCADSHWFWNLRISGENFSPDLCKISPRSYPTGSRSCISRLLTARKRGASCH